jgi:hypothetical protein
MIGIGGAPTRATTLPEDPAERKKYPVASGVLDYFPDAIVAISNLSWRGNEQHNPGQPLHWARSKSADETDTMMRHYLQRGTLDTDGQRHTVKMAWRALAILQKEIEAEPKTATEVLMGFVGQPIEGATYSVNEPPAHAIKDAALVMVDHHENYVPTNKMGLTPDDRYQS